ncbi:MAG: class I tRNA ligase family protein [Alphaproteobacteria bacterium]|nr:class I tRNA ligase family protein [Alphaproteobacteria bacterium]
MQFSPEIFEKKWQQKWQEDNVYRTENFTDTPHCFVLDMFPYPSGSSMHVGHPRGYVATDIYSRFKRMNGFNVLHPMGWDAFGLPAEETAIENKEYPTETVERNIKKFKIQLNMLGLGYDWSREINTTDPEYYVHTQRIFLEFFKRGLATNKTIPVNWCEELGTVLANEDIVDGKSERGGHPVFQKPMRQWILAITKYADRLIDDLDLLDQWPEKIKNAQRNWIGRSEGHEFSFSTSAGIPISIYTTKIETLPGATCVVVAPDGELTEQLLATSTNAQQIKNYITQSSQKTTLERQAVTEKTGVIIEGVTATNPFTKEQIPIIVSDYVLSSYGTGAIMAVPAHDERDSEIAKVFNIESRTVIEHDVLVHAHALNGKTVEEARTILSDMVDAKKQKRYKIRDWVFSRQRFWGEPFPIVWIEGKNNYELVAQGPVGAWLPKEAVMYIHDGKEQYAVPVLPEFLHTMQLPKVASYQPTGTLEGPLAGIDTWVNVFLDPTTGAISQNKETTHAIPARRETNTMPQWAGSSWYWFRYMDTKNKELPFSKQSVDYWGPVHIYAGADHAVAHLIYARFWHKVMQDAGMVDFPEPFTRLEFLGYILAPDGSKISKRKGNSRSPEDVINTVGADAFRMYEMFIGPFEKSAPWSDDGLVGSRRFLERVWRLHESVVEKNVATTDAHALSSIHKTIQKVGNDIETFKFNTAVSSMMICLNEIQDVDIAVADFKHFISILAPFAPHITEEMWHVMGHTSSIHLSTWPTVNKSVIRQESITVPIQINGKVRSQIDVPMDMPEKELETLALEDAAIQKHLSGKTTQKIIIVPNRIVNILV